MLSLPLYCAIPDKESVYNDMIKKYGKINTILAICDNVAEGYRNVNFKAKRGNKYRIKTDIIEIIADGNTIWTYSPKRKSVLISNFDKVDESISLDNIFFNILPNLQPTALKSVLSNNKNKQYRLELNNSSKNEIREVYLYLNYKLTKIEGIEVISNDNNAKLKWDIKKLEINKSISDSTFTFKVPKGVEEIDTR
jgi:outer membrane lipoprotein-sorting protein